MGCGSSAEKGAETAPTKKPNSKENGSGRSSPASSKYAPSSPGADGNGAGSPTERPPQGAQQGDRRKPQPRKIKDVYKIGRTLGTGGFAVVKLGTHRETRVDYAVKIMAMPKQPTNDPDANTREDIFKEINILIGLDHPNVIHLREFYEEGNKIYLVTELLTGGELLDSVLERGTYSEGDARLCFVQLMEGLKYLHARHVVHRDLKLENLLLAKKGDIHTMKIADFGLAKKAAESQLDTVCGTPQYVAPEIIAGIPGLAYTPVVDMWSAGVVLYVLLAGYPPFFDDSEPALFDKIRRGEFSFDDPVWDTVSDAARDLIKQLLVVNPERRLPAKEVLKHRWISGKAGQGQLKGARENLKKNFRSKFRASVSTVMAMNRMKHTLAMMGGGDELSEADMAGAQMAASKYTMLHVGY